jgi:hypothetical protein
MYSSSLACDLYRAGEEVYIDDRFPVLSDAYWDPEDKKVYGKLMISTSCC